MKNDKKERTQKSKTAPLGHGEDSPRFSAFNPMQQERILTNMHTIGTKQEMRRFDASFCDRQTGMNDSL